MKLEDPPLQALQHGDVREPAVRIHDEDRLDIRSEPAEQLADGTGLLPAPRSLFAAKPGSLQTCGGIVGRGVVDDPHPFAEGQHLFDEILHLIREIVDRDQKGIGLHVQPDLGVGESPDVERHGSWTVVPLGGTGVLAKEESAQQEIQEIDQQHEIRDQVDCEIAARRQRGQPEDGNQQHEGRQDRNEASVGRNGRTRGAVSAPFELRRMFHHSHIRSPGCTCHGPRARAGSGDLSLRSAAISRSSGRVATGAGLPRPTPRAAR